MKKILIGFFLAFTIFLVPRSVSASSLSDFPSLSSFDSQLTDNYINDFYSNPYIVSLGFTRDNSVFCCCDSYLVCFLIDSIVFSSIEYDSSSVPVIYSNSSPCIYETSVDFSSLSIYHFEDYSNLQFFYPLIASFGDFYFCNGFASYDNPPFFRVSVPSSSSPFIFHNGFTPPYHDNYLTGFVTGFDYSTEAFVQWLIDTGKYQDLPAYIGTSKLVSFVDFYKQWGSSNKLFVVKILDWMSHFNIGAQSLENRNILKSTIDRLYQEYCNSSYVIFKSNSANNVHHRQNINTKTDDSDLTLVTDDPNDDTITSILRDILRGVIAIPTSIYNNSQAIISKLDSLNWTVNIANDGGASSGSDLTPVLIKMDDIIDKLESDTVSVDIDQTTKDDTDDFFDYWNLEFSTALNNKFPVASQLRTFFTGFFERCGIDADSDGVVYQYYNPGVLTASSISRSAGTASEADIVSDFLGKFDNSDPTFLDDASFQGVPDLSVSVGGHSVSIIDFRVYAKYREKIHFIISFVIWTLYLLHLYKALPSIIGQVADVAVKTSDL